VPDIAPPPLTPPSGLGSAILPVEIDDLLFEAGARRLIDIPRLTIGGGSRTAIMGPNGAGKSILLRLLHGLIDPTAGTIRWAGRPIDRAVRLRQAMVFQQPVLLRRSVIANMRHALKARGYRGEVLVARSREWLAHAGLLDMAARPARLLSGGEQQCLALARALSHGPEVLFLDEPTASLDPASVVTVERLIGEAADNGTKIILVTHDIGQARRLADDVLFLYNGRIDEASPADQFIGRPQSARARAYVEGKIVL